MAHIEWQDYARNAPPTTKEALAELEEAAGISLPEDYAATVIRHSGRVTGLDGVELEEGRAAFGPLFFISSDPEHDGNAKNVYRALRRLRYWLDSEEMWNGLMPFAPSGSNALFCLDYRESADAPPVSFVDMDYAPDEEPSQIVADGFTELLDKLR